MAAGHSLGEYSALVAAKAISFENALRLAFRRDRRTYNLRLRTDDAFDGVTYQAVVPTTPGAWRTRTFTPADFAAVWRGRPVPGAAPLALADVRSVGFLIADRQAGPFRLEVAALTALAANPG